MQGKGQRNRSHYVPTWHRISLFKPRLRNGSVLPRSGRSRALQAAQPLPSPAPGAREKDISQKHVHSPRFVVCVGLLVTRRLIAPQDAKHAVRFAAWNFVWIALWNTVTYTIAPDAQDNEGDARYVVAETTSSSLTRDVSGTPGSRYESAPLAEGK